MLTYFRQSLPSKKQIFSLAFISTLITVTTLILPKLLKITSVWPSGIVQAIPKIGGLDRTIMFEAGTSMTDGSIKSFQWVFELWPPGIPLMNSIAINLNLSMQAYAILFFYTVAIIWAFLMYRTLAGKNLSWIQVAIALAVFLALLTEPFVANNLFLDGLFNSDALGALLGLVSLTYLLDFFNSKSKTALYKFAALASFAAYFRLTWYTLFFVLLVFLIALQTSKKEFLKVTAIALLIFIGISTPMRIYNLVNFETNPINWTKYGKFMVLSPWVPEEKWKNTRDDGTGAYALCALEPEFCEKVQVLQEVPDVNDSEITKITLISWLKNWPQLTKIEIPYIARGYFSSPVDRIPNGAFNFNFGNVLTFVLLLLSLSFVPSNLRREVRWLQFLCCSSFVLPLILLHTEARYLLPLKLLPLIFLPYLMNGLFNFLNRLKLKIQSHAKAT